MDKIVRTVLTWRPGDGVPHEDPLTLSRLDREESRLSISLAGDGFEGPALTPYLRWIRKYIEARSGAIWRQLIVKVLNGLDENSSPSDLNSRALVYAVVAKVLEIVKKSPDVSLQGVVEELEEQDHLASTKNLPRLLNENAGELHVHLVFHIVGWISALWDPDLDETFRVFKVVDDLSKSRKRSLLHVPTIRNLTVRLDDKVVPIYRILDGRFGDLLPNPSSLLNDQDIARYDVESACIVASYVSFHNLATAIDVTIQWTNTLNQHLEYDRRRNVLHVFSAPSLCALSLQLGSEALLAKLFDQYRDGKDNDSSYRDLEFGLFLTEVLLSYRLIFGSNKKSRKRIRPLLPPGKLEKRFQVSCDPLLEILCTKDNKSPEVQALFTDIGVDSVLGDYVSLEEFQFLGKRLIRLERISKSQTPSGIRKFWSDRRDSTAWFATWAVLIIGGGGLLLQALQLVFQIYQV